MIRPPALMLSCGLLLAAVATPLAAQDEPVFAQVTTFRSDGSGHFVLELSELAIPRIVRVVDPPIPQSTYALIMNGPLSNHFPWFYVRDPAFESEDLYAFPINPGTYHVYVVAPPGEHVEIRVTFDRLSGEAVFDMTPTEGDTTKLQGPLGWLGLNDPPSLLPARLDRARLTTEGPAMVITVEQSETFVPAGPLVQAGMHHVQGPGLEANCAPTGTLGVGVLFGVVQERAGFFPVGPGSWELGIDRVVVPPAIDLYHYADGLVIRLDPDDPFYGFENNLWEVVWRYATALGLGWPQQLPEDAKSLIESAACVMVPNPVPN